MCKQQLGEYGVLLTVSYIVLDTMYINRLDVRQRHKSSRFDYPLPQFANLGNEAILPSELNFEPSVQVTLDLLFMQVMFQIQLKLSDLRQISFLELL